MPNWSCPKGPNFKYREGERLLGSFHWDNLLHFYVDEEGRRLSARFDEAKAMVERRAAGLPVEDKKGQARLAL